MAHAGVRCQRRQATHGLMIDFVVQAGSAATAVEGMGMTRTMHHRVYRVAGSEQRCVVGKVGQHHLGGDRRRPATAQAPALRTHGKPLLQQRRHQPAADESRSAGHQNTR